jgi:hypothetical protein
MAAKSSNVMARFAGTCAQIAETHTRDKHAAESNFNLRFIEILSVAVRCQPETLCAGSPERVWFEIILPR